MRFATFILKNLLRRRVRSALAALGIAVSVGAMVALLSISQRFNEATAESFEKRGVDLVVIAAGAADQLSSDMDARLADRVRAIPGVKTVSEGLVTLTEVQKQPGGNSFNAMVQGWPPDNVSFSDLEVLDGRVLGPSDHRKAILGEKMAGNLKKLVGDTVYIQQEPFQVAGIFRSFVVYENGSVVVLLEDLQELMARPDRVTGFSVVLEPSRDKAAQVERVRHAIENLTDEKGRKVGLSAMPTSEFMTKSLHLRLAAGMAWLVSLLAVGIGTIGVLNTMLMSVLERVKEIGILRAVGWPRFRVVRMVLGESVLLSLAGALVGIGGAVLLVKLLVYVPAVNGFIDGRVVPRAITQGFVITLLIGLVGGLYPAYRASRMTPTEALRHE